MAWLAVFTVIFVACNEIESNQLIESNLIEVGFNLNYDISIYEGPITRTNTPTPVYAIDVNEINPNTGAASDYAYGFFSDLSKAKVLLDKSKTYNITAALYFDYFNNYDFYATRNDGSGYIIYREPNEEFEYVTTGWFYGVTAWHYGSSYYTSDIIDCDSHYGKLLNYSPTQETPCSIDLTRISTAIGVEFENFTTGTVSCTLNSYHDNTELKYTLNPGESLSQIFTIGDMVNKESADFRFFVTYYPESGDPVDLISEYATFTRGRKTNYLIKFKTNTNNNESSTSFSFTHDDLEFINEDVIEKEVII